MIVEMVVGTLLLVIGLCTATVALFPNGPQVRVFSGAGGALTRGMRGIFVDPAVPPPATVGPAGSASSAAVRTGGPVVFPGVDPATISQDPGLRVTLQQTLTALDEVLRRLGDIQPESAGGVAAAATDPASRPPVTAPDSHAINPLLQGLFQLCEEELRVDGATAEPPVQSNGRAVRVPAAVVAAPGPATTMPVHTTTVPSGNHHIDRSRETASEPETELPSVREQEELPMPEPTDVSSSSVSLDVPGIASGSIAEIFEVAMTALARALDDADSAVREASVQALKRIEPGTLRAWAASVRVEGKPAEATAAARIVTFLDDDMHVDDLLGLAADAGDPRHDRAVIALRAMPPDQLSRLFAQGAEERPAVVALLPELYEGESLTERLEDLLDIGSEPVRVAALEALGAHADHDTIVRVASQAITGDQSTPVRVAAANILGRIGTDSGSGAPGRASTNGATDLPLDDPETLWDAIRARTLAGDEDVVVEAARINPQALTLAALANADSDDADERALAVRAALAAGTEDGMVIAVLAVADPDPRVRLAAVGVCRRGDVADTVPALRRLVADPDHRVRAAAVETLATAADLDDDDALPSLVLALGDPDERIRARSSQALRERASPALARLLVPGLEVESGRQEAAALLLAMGDTGRQAVAEAFSSLSPPAALAAGPILIAAEGGTDRYIADLVSLDPGVRLLAARVLGAIGDRAATEALVDRLRDPVDDIRIEALNHLAHFGDTDILPLLRQTSVSDPAITVVVAADRAIVEILNRTGPA